jgi:hypothetical protein
LTLDMILYINGPELSKSIASLAGKEEFAPVFSSAFPCKLLAVMPEVLSRASMPG